MIQAAPLIFTPYLRHTLWGGDKICSYKGIPSASSDIGESWEISAVKGHESVVAEGPYKGMTLPQLIDRFGEQLVGERIWRRYGNEFPLLVKFIDAAEHLSVQVHPGEELARKRHAMSGKTEMWYIIATRPEARIYAGLKTRMTPEEFERRVAEGTFAETVAAHQSVPGDVYFLPPGCVHSIGAGNLLAEIQQSSDITYRIYDYDRVDASGKPRELHTALAKEAIDYDIHKAYRNLPVCETEKDTLLVECEYFTTRRILLEGEMRMDLPGDSFTVMMCVHGEARLEWPGGEMALREGHTILLPAVMTGITLSGNATLLVTRA